MQDTHSDSEYGVILRNDEVKEVTGNQYEELEQYRKDGYFVYEISNDYIGIVASITHDYNSRAKDWGYPEMTWSELFPDPDLNILYVKDGQLEFDEYMQHVGNNYNIAEFGYRDGYMDAATSIVNHICYPFKYKRKNGKPVFDITTKKVTQPQLEPKTQLTVPKSAIPNVRKLIEGYNKKAAKWGYELLTFNAGSNTITGKFVPKDDSGGFMSGFKEGWRNGDLGDEWKKILKLCGLG